LIGEYTFGSEEIKAKENTGKKKLFCMNGNKTGMYCVFV